MLARSIPRQKTVRPREIFLRISFSALLCMAGCSSDGHRGSERKPPDKPPWTNVIVYLIDTLRADHLSCYGYCAGNTPFIDRLGKEGVVFERVYAQSPWTKASTGSILTGTYPTVHGADTKLSGVLRSEMTTFAEVLKAKGFATCALSANRWVSSQWGFEQGFGRFHMMWLELKRLGAKPPVRAEHLNQIAVPWIEANKDGPFFLYMHSIDPHDPYLPAAGFEPVTERRTSGV